MEAFHPYPRLPTELRQAIWQHYLDGERRQPQVYAFEFRYSRSNLVATYPGLNPPDPDAIHLHYQAQPEDRIVLQPFSYYPGEGGSLAGDLALLQASTAPWRVAAATCAESRQEVLRLLPDVITFQALPATWGDKHPADDQADEPSNSFPSYALRFNGDDDVILFHANWTDLEAVVRMARMPGGRPHESFARIPNVALGTRGLLQGWSSEGYERCHRHRECPCDTDACPPDDACRVEPLPGFLALFPQLRKLYLADARRVVVAPQYMSMMKSDCKFEFCDSFEGFSSSGYEGWVEKDGTRSLYRCPSKRDDVWPVFQAVDFERGSVVAFDDRDGGCLLPHHRFWLPRDPKVREIRRKWRRVFPWYKSLQHLEIKFMAELMVR
ncbi:HET-domain-containing protein [Apiospora marii]|uniref:HET-domain-containing protein n=1 Tax=Apiospora marii TaxID=335849 RepID=A0ABR1RI53_9PEZI